MNLLGPRLACSVIAVLAVIESPSAFVSSETFISNCLEASDPLQRAECRGYILAIADAINSNVVKGKRVCFPPATAQDDVREEVSRWVRDHARVVQRMHGFGAVYAALIKTYPCGK